MLLVPSRERRVPSRAAAVLLLVLVLVLAAPASSRKLPPVDEGAADPSFRAFRAALRAAVGRRDGKFIRGILDPEVRSGFGSPSGPEAFRREWRPDRRSSPLWKTLGTLLALGGTFRDAGRTEFWAPYVFSAFPDDLDPVEHQVILGKQVPARLRPSRKAPAAVTLSHAIVRVPPPPPGTVPAGDSRWVEIRTPAGRRAYVAREQLRSPLDHRAGFRKVRGQWRLTHLVAGD